MRNLLPALALAGAVSLSAAVPSAYAQNGGDSGSTMSGGQTMMSSGQMPMGAGMSMPGLGLSAGTATTAASTSTSSSGYTCSTGQVTPFSIPRSGVDQNGRPFFFNTDGWYGPYDGFGYPVVTNTIGYYGGQQFARSSRGYIPSPCPANGGSLSGGSAGLGSLTGYPMSGASAMSPYGMGGYGSAMSMSMSPYSMGGLGSQYGGMGLGGYGMSGFGTMPTGMNGVGVGAGR